MKVYHDLLVGATHQLMLGAVHFLAWLGQAQPLLETATRLVPHTAFAWSSSGWACPSHAQHLVYGFPSSRPLSLPHIVSEASRRHFPPADLGKTGESCLLPLVMPYNQEKLHDEEFACMEAQWIADRAALRCLSRQHPQWTHTQLATCLGRSVSWVKKWLRRLREAPADD